MSVFLTPEREMVFKEISELLIFADLSDELRVALLMIQQLLINDEFSINEDTLPF